MKLPRPSLVAIFVRKKFLFRFLLLLMPFMVAGQVGAQVTPTPPWTVSITGPATITEGETADYVVTLSEPHDHGIHVRLIVDVNLGRTATASAGLNSNDWGSLSHTGAERRGTHTRASLRFVGGATTSTLHVPITDDMVAELSSDESLQVSLNVRGWTAAGYFNLGNPRPSVSTTAGSVTTVISDPTSDGLVSLVGPIDAIAMDATGAARNAVFTVRVTGTPTAAVAVAYSVGATGDDATRVAMAADAGADYVSAATGSLTIPMGANPTATISIPTVTPLSSESSEFFTVTLTTVSGGGAGFTPMLGAMDAPTRSAIASIAGLPITITAARNGPANTRYNEGQSITFTLTLSGPQPLSDIFVPWQISRFGTNLNSNPEPEDFGFVTLRQERRITLAEMAAARRTQNPDPITIVVNNVEDDLWDNNFTKLLSFEFPADAPPRGGGLGPIATAGSANDRFFIIAASPAPITLELTARDVTEDGGEQIAWTFQLKQHGRLLRNPMRIGPTIWVSYTQTGTATRGDATDAMDYLLNPDVDDVTRQNNGFDTPTAGRFQWAPATPGAAYQGTILITPTDDSTYGGDKTVTMTLSNFLSTCSSGNTCPSAYNFAGLNAGETMFSTAAASASATLRIIDDEPQLSLAAPDPATVAEGGALTYTVTLRNPPSTGSITVDYAVAADSDDDTENAAAGDFDDNNDGTANTAFPSGTLTFATGETSKDITVRTFVDSDTENAEVFVLTLSNAGPSSANVGIDANATSATGTINANTATSRTIALSAAATTVVEGGSIIYTVSLTGSPPAAMDDVDVSWSVAADSDADTNDAAAGDFDDNGDGTANTAFPSGTVTFTSSDVADKTFTVQTHENTASELDRTYVVTITVGATDGGGSTTLGTASSTATINDDDPLTAEVTLTKAALVEGTDTQAAFGVELSGATGVTLGDDVTATFEIANTSTATGGASTVTTRDYTTPSSLTVTVSSGSLTGAFNLALNNDNLNEGAETIIVNLMAVSGANVSLSTTPADLTQTATIAANDPTTVSIAGPGANVSEGNNATFTLTFAGGVPSDDVTLPYTITGSGITAGDLGGGAQLTSTESIGIATINAATTQNPVTFSIAIASDGVVEAQETLTLTLDNTQTSSPGGAGGGGVTIASGANSATASVTIPANDDAVIAIAPAAATVGEGDTSAAVEFTLSLVDATDTTSARTVPAALMVTYTLSGTAAGGIAGDAARDYTTAAATGTLTLAAASSTATLSLPINNDVLNEAGETVIITLAATATGGGDGTVTVPTAVADRRATATITDNDAITVAITGGGTVTEGADATFTVALSGGTSTTAVTAAWSVGADSDAMTMDTATADTSPNSGTVNLAAGATMGTFTVNAVADVGMEPAEVFVVSLGTVTASGGGAISVSSTMGSATATISANAAVSRNVNIAGPTTVAEGAASTNYTISVGGTALTANLTVNWSVGVDSDAATANANAGDFDNDNDGTVDTSLPSGSVMFSTTDSTDKTFTIRNANDNFSRADRVYVVTVAIDSTANGGIGTNLGDASVTTTINDNDLMTATLAIADATLDEGDTASYTISIAGANANIRLGEAATVTWEILGTSTVEGGAASNNNRDYTTPASFDVTLAAQASTATFTLVMHDDPRNEGEETLNVRLSAISGSNTQLSSTMSDITATATVAANDPTTISVADAGNTNEGATATFVVTLGGGAPTADLVLPYTLSGVPAEDLGTAHASLSGELRILWVGAGTTDNIDIAIADDNLIEPAETLTLTLGTLSGGGGGGVTVATTPANSGSGTATIPANDPGTVVITAAAASVDENAANAAVTFNINLMEGTETRVTTAAATINYTLSGTATRGIAANNLRDYTTATAAATGTITVASGASSAMLTLPIFNDAINEPDETVILTLNSVTGGGGTVMLGGGAMNEETITIDDDDDLAVTVAAESAAVEERSSVDFTITLSHSPQAAVVVPWTLNELSDPAVIGDASGMVSFASRTTTLMQTVTVPIGNSLTLHADAPDETLNMMVAPGDITGGNAVTVTGSPAAVTVSFVDGQRFSVTNTMVDEGGDVTVTIARNGTAVPTDPMTITWAVATTGTTTGHAATADFPGGALPDGGDLTFPAAGMSDSMTVTISTLDDNLSEGAETFAVNLSATAEVLASNMGVALVNGQVTITDDDILAIAPVAGAGYIIEEQTSMFSVSLMGNARPTANLTMTWTVAGAAANGIAAATAADFMGSAFPTGTVTFAPDGESTQMISITTSNGGGSGSPMRAFTITLSNIAGGGGGPVPPAPEATRSIISEDAHILSVADVSVLEGGTATVTVTRNSFLALANALTVTWSVVDSGTATAADFPGGTLPSGGELTFDPAGIGSSALSVTVATFDDNLSEGSETFAVNLSAAMTVLASNDGVALTNGTATITDNDTLELALSGPGTIVEERASVYTVRLAGSARPTTDLAMTWMVTAPNADTTELRPAVVADFDDNGDGVANTATDGFPSGTVTFTVGGAITQTITITTSDGGGEDTPMRALVLSFGEPTGGVPSTGDGTTPPAPGTMNINLLEDNPGERATAVAAPLASVGQSVAQLASAAVGERLAFTGGSAVRVGGQTVSAVTPEQRAAASGAWAADPFERRRVTNAGGVIGGNAMTMKEILQSSSFALSIGGSAGLNFWGSAGSVSSNGETDGVTYDGDSTAWHLGVDTAWRNGLFGFALSQVNSDTDFTSGGSESKLESNLTSLHPYITRNLSGGAQWWAGLGYGTGDADLIEDGGGVTIKSDLSVLSASGGLSVTIGEGFKLNFGGTWSRAELDGGSAQGRVLPAVTADSGRTNVGMEVGVNFTERLRPFATLNIRYDFGDGDEGGGVDYGGGVEWNSANTKLRLEGSDNLQGEGVDEERLSLTIRHETGGASGFAPYMRWNLDTASAGAQLRRGRFSVGMEVGVKEDGVELKNLLRGEVAF